MITLYVGSDNLVTVDKLMNQRTGAYVNNAAVTVNLLDAGLQNVEGGQGLVLEYVADSDGKYQGVLPYSLSLTSGATYYLDVTMSATQQRFDRLRAKAQYASGN